MPDITDDRAKLIANERTKLTATYLNGAAIAVLAVGGLAPLFAAKAPGSPFSWVPALNLLVCWLVSGALHWGARKSLKELQ